jgi:hypothetical protein
MEMWILSVELVLAVLLEILLCAWAVAWIWLLPKLHQEQRQHEATLDRYSRWACPNCQQPFGRAVEWQGLPDEGRFDIQGEPFNPHVCICCPHCSFLNSFDETGRPQFGQGVYHNYEEIQIREARWERIAAQLVCPRCGSSFKGWSGSWGTRDQPLGSSSPLLICPACGAQACVIESEDGPSIAHVWFEGQSWRP